jgi:hypothetical protein
MRNKQVKKMRKIGRNTAHNQNESTTQGTFQAYLPENYTKEDQQGTNIYDAGERLVFVQRVLDSFSLKHIVKQWKKTFKKTPRPNRFSFVENLNNVEVL